MARVDICVYDACVCGRAWAVRLCSCPVFTEHLVCKHVLAIAIFTGEIQTPPEMSPELLGQNRKKVCVCVCVCVCVYACMHVCVCVCVCVYVTPTLLHLRHWQGRPKGSKGKHTHQPPETQAAATVGTAV